MITFHSTSEEMTLSLGERLAKVLRPGMVVSLDGDLGCGKTVISRGVARGLGITEAVTSPTFTDAQEYRYGGGYLYHLDMYRIPDENSALAFGIDEFIFNPNAITLVEWPERIAALLQDDRRLRHIRFRHLSPEEREITFVDWSDEECAALAGDSAEEK